MDPKACLKLIQEAWAALLADPQDEDLRLELVGHLRDLADWVEKGGFLPPLVDALIPVHPEPVSFRTWLGMNDPVAAARAAQAAVGVQSCSWCHEANPFGTATCKTCGHHADRPRMHCTCPQCRP